MYLWLLLLIGLIKYGWFFGDGGSYEATPGYREGVCYVVFLCFNTLRSMGIALYEGIHRVDRNYNYILNESTGKVRLRYFMDHFCDDPAGIVIGFIYPDAGKAIREGLIWNITFPKAYFLFTNMIVFYLPMLVVSALQTDHDKMRNMFIAAAVLCAVGIVSNAWRFRMKNEMEKVNANA